MLNTLKRLFSSHPTDKQQTTIINMVNLSINRAYWFRLKNSNRFSKKTYMPEVKTKLKKGYFSQLSKNEAKALINANKLDFDTGMSEIQYNTGRKGLWNA